MVVGVSDILRLNKTGIGKGNVIRNLPIGGIQLVRRPFEPAQPQIRIPFCMDRKGKGKDNLIPKSEPQRTKTDKS